MIAEAWVRVRPRPEFKASCGVEFDDFHAAAASGPRDLPVGPLPLELPPARRARGGDDRRRLGREEPAGARLRVRPSPRRRADGPGPGNRPQPTAAPRAPPALRGRRAEIRGILIGNRPVGGESGDAVGAWRGAFLLAPYLRDTFVACGVLSETFETAITWDRFEEFHADDDGGGAGARSPRSAVRPPRVPAPPGQLPLHPRLPRRPGALLHRDRPAIRGGEVEQWDEIKAAAAEA